MFEWKKEICKKDYTPCLGFSPNITQATHFVLVLSVVSPASRAAVCLLMPQFVNKSKVSLGEPLTGAAWESSTTSALGACPGFSFPSWRWETPGCQWQKSWPTSHPGCSSYSSGRLCPRRTSPWPQSAQQRATDRAQLSIHRTKRRGNTW